MEELIGQKKFDSKDEIEKVEGVPTNNVAIEDKPFAWDKEDEEIARISAQEKVRQELQTMSDGEITNRNKRRESVSADLEELDRKMTERIKKEEAERLEGSKIINRVGGFFKRIFRGE